MNKYKKLTIIVNGMKKTIWISKLNIRWINWPIFRNTPDN